MNKTETTTGIPPDLAAEIQEALDDLAKGIRRYIDWIKAQSDVRDYFTEAVRILRGKGIIHRVEMMND